jgi:hypothetical protein
MTQDPKNASVTAKIEFEGIMLFCMNADGNCEVGLIDCPDHEFEIRIQTLGPRGLVGFDKVFNRIHDLYIQVVNPEVEGVTQHNVGGEEDFNQLPDLEGPDMHNDKVAIDTSKLLLRFAINAGKLFVEKLTEDEFDLIKWSAADPAGKVVKKVGKLVDILSMNLVCRDEEGSGIAIFNAVTGDILEWLPKLPNTTYTIKIDNDCGTSTLGPNKSDFRFYYHEDVVKPKDERRFDFDKHVIGPPSPDVCLGSRASRTGSLGLRFRPQAKPAVAKKQEGAYKTEYKK